MSLWGKVFRDGFGGESFVSNNQSSGEPFVSPFFTYGFLQTRSFGCVRVKINESSSELCGSMESLVSGAISRPPGVTEVMGVARA